MSRRLPLISCPGSQFGWRWATSSLTLIFTRASTRFVPFHILNAEGAIRRQVTRLTCTPPFSCPDSHLLSPHQPPTSTILQRSTRYVVKLGVLSLHRLKENQTHTVQQATYLLLHYSTHNAAERKVGHSDLHLRDHGLRPRSHGCERRNLG